MIKPQYTHCRYDVDGPVLTITINRPEVLNALHPDGHFELDDAFNRYAADPNLRVAIITATGDRAFCVGTDVKALAATGNDKKPATGFAGITHRFDLWKPVIAAVNGLCLGGGVEIVSACDLAISAEHAEFALSEPLVGLAALGGGALQRLARDIPLKDAMYLVLTAKRVSANEAKRMGMINDVVPASQLLDAVRTLASDILKCAPLSIEASKQVMLQSLDEQTFEHAMRRRYGAADRMLASNDAREGPRAFAEKRKPNWTGT